MRQPTPVAGSFLVAALVASGLLGGGLLAGCQRQEPSRPSGPTSSPTPQASLPAASPAAPSPTSEASPAGRQLFLQTCASCHGNEGKGDGPAAAALSPKPADLTTGTFKHGGSPQEIFRTITSGVPGTAMMGRASTPEKVRWNLVDYVLSLSRKK